MGHPESTQAAGWKPAARWFEIQATNPVLLLFPWVLILRCPTCQRVTEWEDNPWRPFCSERCQLIDLGRWATGEYRIPQADGSDHDEDEPPADSNSEDHA